MKVQLLHAFFLRETCIFVNYPQTELFIFRKKDCEKKNHTRRPNQTEAFRI